MRPEAILGSANPSENLPEQELVYPVRFYAGMGKPRFHVPANDNHPDRVTRFVIHNGGCSTASDFAAVSLARVPTLDKPEVPYSEMELAA